MSRIGRKPITVPAGVTVTLGDANVVTVKGPLGTLTQQFNANMTLTLDAGVLTVTRPDDEAANRAAHGLTRTLLENMIVGVSTGYSKTLQIVGVGYRCALQGQNLLLNLGYSHPITVEAPEGITFEVPDTNTIIVKGYDKQVVGQIAAVIRSKRKPEPYHGKGVKYSTEVVRRKAGKAGGKGK